LIPIGTTIYNSGQHTAWKVSGRYATHGATETPGYVVS